MMPANSAAARTLPFFESPASALAKVSRVMRTRPCATASRAVTGFSPTSTMRAWPPESRWVRSSAITFPESVASIPPDCRDDAGCRAASGSACPNRPCRRHSSPDGRRSACPWQARRGHGSAWWLMQSRRRACRHLESATPRSRHFLSRLLAPRMVFGPGLDPAGAGGAAFLFPQRRIGLEIVHKNPHRLESLAAMRGQRRHQHNRFARPDLSHTMDHQQIQTAETLVGILRQARDLAFGEAGIMVYAQFRY